MGSRRGGFLDRLPLDLWHTPDGEMVTAWAGLLANLRCLVSGDRFTRQRVGRRRDLNSQSTWPVRDRVRRGEVYRIDEPVERWVPDEHDIERRFPRVRALFSPTSASEREQSFGALTRLIEDLEGSSPSAISGELRWLGPGTLAYNDKLGVTVLTSCEPPSKFWAVDLSLDGNRTVKYSGHMKPIPSDYPSRVGCWSRNIAQLLKV